MQNSNDSLALVIQVLMAAGGALARILTKSKEILSVGRVLGELFTAGFTGLLLYWVTRDMESVGSWAFVASGIAGWVGPQVLDWLTELVAKKTGIKPSEKEG